MINLYGTQIDPKSILAPEDFKAEWREHVTDEEYHADKTAVGSSSLRKTKKSMFAFAGAMWGQGEKETDAMRFGSLVHLAMLQPQKFKDFILVMPEFTGYTQKGELSTRSKEAIEKKNKWLAEVPKDAIVVEAQEQEKLLCMIDSVLSHPRASLLLKNVKTEVAGYWRDPVTGIRCKIKPDILTFDSEILVDLKTCRDCYWPEFRRTVEAKKYYFQDAMYRQITGQITGIEPQLSAWIAVENVYPYETAVHPVHYDYRDAGAKEFRHALDMVKVSIDENNFSQYKLSAEDVNPTKNFLIENDYNY